MSVITRGIRNAFRNVTRTIAVVTILGISLGMSLVMFIADKAISGKVETTLSSIANTITVHATQSNTPLAVNEVSKIAAYNHVKRLTMRVDGQVQPTGTTDQLSGASLNPKQEVVVAAGTTNLRSPSTLRPDESHLQPGVTIPSNFSPPISFIGLNNPIEAEAIGVTGMSLTAGNVFDGTRDENKALISGPMASLNNVTIGSTFTAYGTTFTITGLFDGQTDSGNNVIIVPLPVAQRLLNQPNQLSGAVITVDSLRNLSTVTTQVTQLVGASATVQSRLDEANRAIEPLTSVQQVSRLSLIGALIASAFVVFLTMVMIVRERQREIGILKALGGSNSRIILQFMSEALTFAMIGTLVGLVIGMVAGSPLTQALVGTTQADAGAIQKLGANVSAAAEQLQTQVGWEVILFGFGAAVLIALVSSTLAAFFISRIKPAVVLRSE
jgi:putative ABC transport system permease protein